jgi:putative oxidoreductase
VNIRGAETRASLGPRVLEHATLVAKGVPEMNSIVRFFLRPEPGPASIALIRLAVGLIFFTQGILKYTDPGMGVLRFTRIGFPYPFFTAHFVGTFEIVCGFLLLLGLWTRVAAVPLWIVIATAIATTKIPELYRANQGFWFMVSDARADFAMFCSLLFLIRMGGGAWSVDAARRRDGPV